MVLTSTSLPDSVSDRILCYYVNLSDRLQIARIRNVPGLRFERLIFPNQRLLFEATPEALLEIDFGTTQNSAPLQQISCLQLQVIEIPKKTVDSIL